MALLRLGYMKPTEIARQHIERLLNFGVSQKVIAARMGVSEATFSRWYRAKPDSKGNPAKIPAEALDRLEGYVEELLLAFSMEPQRVDRTPSTAVGERFPERRKRDDGPPAGIAERRHGQAKEEMTRTVG